MRETSSRFISGRVSSINLFLNSLMTDSTGAFRVKLQGETKGN